MISILSCVKWYLIVVLICISLMASDAEHPLIYLWALCMSFLKKYLFKSLAHFLIGLLVFLVWHCVSSLFILEFKHLSKVSLVSIFSHRVGSLFILLMFSLDVQKLFNLMWTNQIILSAIKRNIYLWNFTACFPLRLLWYPSLYLSLLSILSLFCCMVQIGGLVLFIDFLHVPVQVS